jgi:indole-3-glycerol phosphate synthase
MSCERHREIRRRRQRKKKIRKLRTRLAETTNPSEQAHIIAQIRRISPYAPISEDQTSD